MWGILIALLSGALMSVQGVFNTELTKQTSLWVSTGWVQISAFLVCVAAWLFTGRESVGALMKVENKYILLGGVIGAFITVTVIQSMSSLGPAKAAMLIVIAQLAVAYLIELFGMFGVEKVDFQWRKLLGMAIAIAGIVIFKWEKQTKTAGCLRLFFGLQEKKNSAILKLHFKQANRCFCRNTHKTYQNTKKFMYFLEKKLSI